LKNKKRGNMKFIKYLEEVILQEYWIDQNDHIEYIQMTLKNTMDNISKLTGSGQVTPFTIWGITPETITNAAIPMTSKQFEGIKNLIKEKLKDLPNNIEKSNLETDNEAQGKNYVKNGLIAKELLVMQEFLNFLTFLLPKYSQELDLRAKIRELSNELKNLLNSPKSKKEIELFLQRHKKKQDFIKHKENIK
jgi:hypothetical protein